MKKILEEEPMLKLSEYGAMLEQMRKKKQGGESAPSEVKQEVWKGLIQLFLQVHNSALYK